MLSRKEAKESICPYTESGFGIDRYCRVELCPKWRDVQIFNIDSHSPYCKNKECSEYGMISWSTPHLKCAECQDQLGYCS